MNFSMVAMEVGTEFRADVILVHLTDGDDLDAMFAAFLVAFVGHLMGVDIVVVGAHLVALRVALLEVALIFVNVVPVLVSALLKYPAALLHLLVALRRWRRMPGECNGQERKNNCEGEGGEAHREVACR